MDSGTLSEGLAYLASVDADFARVLERHGPPAPRESARGYPALLRFILGQQVSVSSAAATWDRLAALADPMTPATVFALSDEALRGIGFSRQKSRYAKALASDILEGRIDLDAIDMMEDEAAIDVLMTAKGIGRWTAEIYLMFALGRRDIMPAADLGVIVALQHLKGLPARPHVKQLLELAEPWRPWRSAACLLLWHYYYKIPV